MQNLVRKLGFDGVLSILFIVAAIVAYAHTYTFADTAAIWPRWVITTFGVLSALVPVSKFLARDAA
ncbi:hypothetical protein [Salipiger sp.]|uniref:hypothetical protein n=1 Tax=Salipiger sp. TaxID=2078585 RepID=UPI003A976878